MYFSVRDSMSSISTQKQEIDRQNWALRAHAEAITAVSRASTEAELISSVCKVVASQPPYVLAWVGIAQHDASSTVQSLGSFGSASPYIDQIVVSWSADTPMGRGPAGEAIRTNKVVVINDVVTDSHFTPWLSQVLRFGIRSCIAVPVLDEERKPFAVLLVYSSERDSFNTREINLFQTFATEVGFGLVVIKRQRLLASVTESNTAIQNQLAAALRATIEAMSKTMESRDPYTAGHQKSVAKISVALAAKMGWTEAEQQVVYLAGLVHDIGKIAVPSEILTKPSKLSELEMSLVRQHVEAGYQILKDIPFPWPIASIVRQHHERLDGSGYPQQLIGNEILPGARVLAVADMIEAMSTHRPYRPALGLEFARSEIKRESGVTLDSAVVEAACALMQEGRLEALIGH